MSCFGGLGVGPTLLGTLIVIALPFAIVYLLPGVSIAARAVIIGMAMAVSSVGAVLPANAKISDPATTPTSTNTRPPTTMMDTVEDVAGVATGTAAGSVG